MPVTDKLEYRGYFNTSPECWSVFTEVVGHEFGDAVLYGQAHQISVDAYAVQHAGGSHPDKSVDIHLAGLYLVLERCLAPPSVPRLLQRLAGTIESWPHFPPPADRGSLTVLEVALADSGEDHIRIVRSWGSEVWDAWSDYHQDVATLVRQQLGLD